MLMVAEMTGSLSLLAPAMIAVAVATAIVGDETIYEAQLRDRSSSRHHRLKLSFPMLASLGVRDAMDPAPVVVSAAPVGEVAAQLRRVEARGVAVIDPGGRPLGAVGRSELERAAARDPSLPINELVAPVVVSSAATLEDAMLAQARGATHVALVIERGIPVGIATAQGIVDRYRAAREAHPSSRRRTNGREARTSAETPPDRLGRSEEPTSLAGLDEDSP
jgi:CIC family chloride channel protein